jgi:oxygen-independent coproporphyrinogen III oxidase
MSDSLRNQSLERSRSEKKIRHLYVHIPFCPHICPYCAFHVIRSSKAGTEILIPKLLEEFNSASSSLELSTIFLGGGTPTSLSTSQLEQFLTVLISKTSVDRRNLEVTSECNPSTLSLQKAQRMVDLGVNRLSIGAQSFDPTILKTLGRTHSATAITDCISTARSAGFTNINVDLIFGVPGQTLDSWRSTLEAVLSQKPQHVSCYGLTYEEDTDFFRRNKTGELGSNSLEKEMFELADEVLCQAGLVHYEISNYALPGFECRHNLAYWRGKEFLGIGPSAVSTIGGIRQRNSKFDGQSWHIEEEEVLTSEILASERMALGLRTAEGICEDNFHEEFGFSPNERWRNEIEALEKNQLLQRKPSLRLTTQGRAVADEVAVYFMK